MSFFEDYVEDGLCCMCCGQLIDGEEPGYPRECEFCSPQKLKKKKKKKGTKMQEQVKNLCKLSEDNQERYDEELKEDILNRKTTIISVIYEDNKEPKKFDKQSRTYSYYTQLKTLQVGDIVECPVGKNNKRSVIGQVAELNVSETKIEAFKDKVKEITTKYNKQAFFEKDEYQVEEEIEIGTKNK